MSTYSHRYSNMNLVNIFKDILIIFIINFDMCLFEVRIVIFNIIIVLSVKYN